MQAAINPKHISEVAGKIACRGRSSIAPLSLALFLCLWVCHPLGAQTAYLRDNPPWPTGTWVDAKQYDDLQAAIADLRNVAEATLVIANEFLIAPKGHSTTIATPNISLWFLRSGKLSFRAGQTVTIEGPLYAGRHQIFTTRQTDPPTTYAKEKDKPHYSGVQLTHVDAVYPEWWGASTFDVPPLSPAATSTRIINRVAIDASLGSADSGILVLGPGTYQLEGSVQGASDWLIAGSGIGRTILQQWANGPAVITLSNRSNFGLRDCTIEGNKKAYVGILIERCDNVIIKACAISNVGMATASDDIFGGVALSGSKNVTIEDCVITDVGVEACYENKDGWPISGGIALYDSQCVDISSCLINRCDSQLSATQGCVRVNYEGCGIVMMHSTDVSISHSEICQCNGTGVLGLGSTRRADVRNCFLHDNKYHGGAWVDIAFVACASQTKNCIDPDLPSWIICNTNRCTEFFGVGEDIVVTDNTCNSSNDTGILLGSVKHFAVSNNLCQNHSRHGICLYQIAAPVPNANSTGIVSGNVCSGNSWVGIQVNCGPTIERGPGEEVPGLRDAAVVVSNNVLVDNGTLSEITKDKKGDYLGDEWRQGNAGVYVEAARGVIISNNQIRHNKHKQIRLNNNPIGLPRSVIEDILKTPNAKDKLFWGMNGIFLRQASSCIIEGNIVENIRGCGIRVDRNAAYQGDNTIANNHVRRIYDIVGHNIEHKFNGESKLIVLPTRDPEGHGICVTGTGANGLARTVVIGNHIARCERTGVAVTDLSELFMRGNVIRETGTYGVSLTNVNVAQIVGNHFINNKQAAYGLRSSHNGVWEDYEADGPGCRAFRWVPGRVQSPKNHVKPLFVGEELIFKVDSGDPQTWAWYKATGLGISNWELLAP